MARSEVQVLLSVPHSQSKVVILSRSYWVKRGDWEIGPVHERQFQNMIQQRWFRETDEVRTSEHGPWQSATRVVPRDAFQLDSDDVDLEDGGPDGNDDLDDAQFEQRLAPKGAPQWFRPRRSKPSPERRASSFEEERDDESGDPDDGRNRRPPTSPASSDHASGDIHFVTAEIDNREFLSQDRVRPNSSSRDESDDGDLEVEVFLDDDEVDESHGQSRRDRRRGSTRPEALKRASLPDLDADDDDSADVSRKVLSRRRTPEPEKPKARKPEVATALPSEFELDVESMRPKPESRTRTSETKKKDDVWTHNESGAPQDDDTQRKAVEAKREFKLSHTEPVDFAHAARMAAEMSAASLPAMPVLESSAPLMTEEERGIRRAIREPHFLPVVRAMLLTIGIQICAIAVATNAWCFLAFKRLFILCMEVFIPFQQGSSGEVLLETDLMFCGIAMACTFALPFLPLTYIFKMDGRVLQYLGSLGGAFLAALILNQVVVDDISGIVAAILLLSVPSAVISGLAITLGVKMTERHSKLLLFGVWAASALAATAFAVSSPTFGLVNRVRDFPPSIEIFGAWGYLAAVGYIAKLSLIYAVLFRSSRHLCDRATREFIMQHIVFHGVLSVVVLLALGSVQSGLLTGWASIPAALTSLVALVAQGFNLWSMATHVEPFLGGE